MKQDSFNFVTDTATLCIFDLECLKHRLDDDCDWWSIPSEELMEVNNANVLFLGLGVDGQFNVTVIEDVQQPKISAVLKVISGKVFLGAGEEVTADDLEPECVRGGKFIDIEPGVYLIKAKLAGAEIVISFAPCEENKNRFDDLLRLGQ